VFSKENFHVWNLISIINADFYPSHSNSVICVFFLAYHMRCIYFCREKILPYLKRSSHSGLKIIFILEQNYLIHVHYVRHWLRGEPPPPDGLDLCSLIEQRRAQMMPEQRRLPEWAPTSPEWHLVSSRSATSK
jgi:hypothetical protein